MTRVNIYELLPVSYVGLPMRQALRHINTREWIHRHTVLLNAFWLHICRRHV